MTRYFSPDTRLKLSLAKKGSKNPNYGHFKEIIKCSVEGCVKAAYCKGLCEHHYYQQPHLKEKILKRKLEYNKRPEVKTRINKNNIEYKKRIGKYCACGTLLAIGNESGLCRKCCEASQEHLNKITASGNPNWKGDAVGYNALHGWVKRRLKKPSLCNCCGNVPPYDLANISGNYLRDLNDWEWLCRKCHMTSDKRLEKLILMNKSKGERNAKVC